MKKGFTLIELLAVIVILGIIALIATPIVLDLIDSSKEKTIEVSAKNYIRAVDNVLLSKQMEDNEVPDGTYQIMSNGNICLTVTSENCSNILEIKVDGARPTEGKIKIVSSKVVKLRNVKINDLYIVFNEDSGIIVRDTSICQLVDVNDNKKADTGEMVTCGTESFYVIPNDPVAHPGSSGKISMLAAQNIEISTDKPKQSDSAGTAQFADNNYWSDREFRSFVYDNNTIISDYVNAYKETLKDIGLSADITTTLVSLNQLTSSEVGCTVHESQGWGECSAAPSWVSNVSYCTGSTHYPDSDYDNLFKIDGNLFEAYSQSFTSSYGVRPVVILNEEDIEFVGLEAGLYDENNNLVATFEELKSKYNIDIEEDDNSYSGYQQFYEDGVLSSVNKIIIPDGITKIGAGVFVLSDIESITIPSSVESIGDYAFWQSYISEVKMKEGLKTIGTGAFEDCMNLTSIKIPPSVTSIGSSAFGWSSVTTIYYSGDAEGAPWGATDATVIRNY